MTSHDILEFLKSNNDQRFTSYAIAKRFNVTTQTINMTLAQLSNGIKTEINGKSREYWYESEFVVKQKQEREAYLLDQANKRKKVYQLPQSTQDALARAREGRSPDFGYITIS